VELIEWPGKSEKIRMDNVPKIIAGKLTNETMSHRIKLQYIQPGKPKQNSLIERCKRTFRTDFLDVHRFEHLV